MSIVDLINAQFFDLPILRLVGDGSEQIVRKMSGPAYDDTPQSELVAARGLAQVFVQFAHTAIRGQFLRGRDRAGMLPFQGPRAMEGDVLLCGPDYLSKLDRISRPFDPPPDAIVDARPIRFNRDGDWICPVILKEDNGIARTAPNPEYFEAKFEVAIHVPVASLPISRPKLAIVGGRLPFRDSPGVQYDFLKVSIHFGLPTVSHAFAFER
jgi:hypothetical protein